MKLLFIEAGTKYKEDNDNNYYTDGNLNTKIWERYNSYCDSLTILGRFERKIYSNEYAKNNFNIIPKGVKMKPLYDIYASKIDFINPLIRKKIKNQIKEEIRNNDFIIIRSITKFYTLYAAKVCRKMNKNYLIEVTGSAFWTLWHRGDIFGRILALPTELLKKYEIKKAKNVLYVTNKWLQKEYPCSNHVVGCSDVEINVDDSVLLKRKKVYNNNKSKIIIGTIGNVDTKLKGQQDVIYAIKLLKEKYNIDNIEYQLVGRGNQEYLNDIAEKNGVSKYIKQLGQKPHEDVINWLDMVDIYIQPSYVEGLCRAMVEAMSRGCMLLASNAGGNIELVDDKHSFKPGDINTIARLISEVDNQTLLEESIKNFNKSKKYEKKYLDNLRDTFYKDSINKK